MARARNSHQEMKNLTTKYTKKIPSDGRAMLRDGFDLERECREFGE